MDRRLLADLVAANPFEPATQVWRAVEVRKLLDAGLPEGRGLDLGCGDGRLTALLLERVGARQLVGVEPDPAEAEMARASGVYTTVHTVGGDRVPEPDASFDWALSNSVLEHIDDLQPVLRETARLLRPEGVFVLTVPAPHFHEVLRGPLLPGASRAAYLQMLDARLAHIRYWDVETWREELEAAGLRLDTADGYLSRAETRRWETVSRFTAGVLYGLMGRRRRPIEIQRALGVRRSRRRAMPRWPFAPVAWLLSAGVSNTGPSACLYIRAKKEPS